MKLAFVLIIGVSYVIRICRADDDSEIIDLKGPENETADEYFSKYKSENEQYDVEKKAGSISDLFATNPHHAYSERYKDLSRRFILQYPYNDVSNKHLNEDVEAEESLDKAVKDFQDENSASRLLKPVKAPPELVLAVAKQSAIIEASKPVNPSEHLIQKDVLRSGNYWNDVWKEDADTKILRSRDENDSIQSVKVSIMPGSKLYELVSVLKKVSPRLIYVINKD